MHTCWLLPLSVTLCYLMYLRAAVLHGLCVLRGWAMTSELGHKIVWKSFPQTICWMGEVLTSCVVASDAEEIGRAHV